MQNHPITLFILSVLISLTIARVRLPFRVLRQLDTQETSNTSLTPSTLTTIPLINNNNLDYLLNVSIGSNQQPLTLLINTNSPVTYILTNSTLDNSTVFDCSASQTCVNTQQTQTLTIENVTVSGEILTDTITLGNITVQNQSIIAVAGPLFNLAQNAAINVSAYLIEGTLGLGFSSDNSSVLDNLVAQGVLQEKNYSIYLSNNVNNSADDNSSNLILGGFDPKYLQKSNFTYLPLAVDDDWIVNLTGVTTDLVGGPSLSTAAQVMFAAGEPFIIPTEADYQLIMTEVQLFNPNCTTNAEENLVCACEFQNQVNSFPRLVFSFNDVNSNAVKFTLAPENYVLWQNQSCILQIAATPGYDIWVLGAPFLRAYYSFWDQTNRQIGLVAL